MVWMKTNTWLKTCISIPLRSVYNNSWLSASTQCGLFVLVYTGRCAWVELTPIGADSLRAHLRFGVVQCYWQHSLTSTITGGRIWFMHQCVFLGVLHRDDHSMHFTNKARTILVFPHKDRSTNNALCFYGLFTPSSYAQWKWNLH